MTFFFLSSVFKCVQYSIQYQYIYCKSLFAPDIYTKSIRACHEYKLVREVFKDLFGHEKFSFFFDFFHFI